MLTVLSVLTSENSFPQAKLVDRREYGLKSTAPAPASELLKGSHSFC